MREEIGCEAIQPKHFATFEGQAHDPTKTIRTPCYLIELKGEISPKAEIEEIAWIDKDYEKKGIQVAPMLRLHIIPELIRKGLL